MEKKKEETTENAEVKEGEEEVKEEVKVIEPKTRPAGGIWIMSNDFGLAFQYMIVYHNPQKYPHTVVHNDIWEDGSVPFNPNLKLMITLSDSQEEDG